MRRAPPARCLWTAVLLLCALRLPALAPRSVGAPRRVAASAAGAGAGEPGALDAASLTDLRFGPSLAGDPLERLRFAMILYSRVHGSSWLDVPPGFVAPDDWPEPVRGLALGKAVAALVRLEAAARGGETRRSATSPDSGMETARDLAPPRPSRTRWGRLLTESTGFDWGGALSRDGARRFGALVRALAAYKAEFGDVAVARGFRVPNADPWPPELAGVDLDRAVYGMGFYRAHVVGFPDRQRELRDLGFVRDRAGKG